MSKPQQSQSQGSPSGKGKANEKTSQIPSTLQKKDTYASATEALEKILTNPEFHNWVKSGLALGFTNGILRPFVANKIKVFHESIRAKLKEGVSCDGCKVNTKCKKNVCNIIQHEIENGYRNGQKVSFTNTCTKLWLDEPWEIAKCYMPPSKGNRNSSASTADFSASINVIINCKHVLAFDPNDPCDSTTVFIKSRDFRNSVMHSSEQRVTEHDMVENLNTLIKIINRVSPEIKCGTEKEIKMIEKIKTNQWKIESKDVKEVKKNAEEAIADERDKGSEQDKLPFGDLLSAESLAHGQVFSHFTGFLRKVLPGFPDWIKEKAENEGLPLQDVCKKYFILLPDSCKIQDSLATKDDNKKGLDVTICHESSLEREEEHAGKLRKYKLSLYSISNGEKKFYFVADYPNVLGAIRQLKDLELADVEPKYQIVRFYHKLNELINHTQNAEFNDTVQIVRFNDKEQRLEDVLFQEVEKSPHLQQSPYDNQIVSQEPIRPNPPTSTRIHGSPPHADAYLSYFEDEESTKVADEIKKYLSEKGKSVAQEKPDISWYEQLERGKWVIFVISRKFVTSNSEALACMSALGPGIGENNSRILPVICEGADVEKIPGFRKFLTHVSQNEPNYLENIVQTMNGDPIRKCDKIPCGDVATGLACAYVLNYLVLTLVETGFVPRIRRFLRDKKIEEKGEVKLIILVPKTCRVPDSVLKEAENCRDSNRSIELLGDLEPTTMNQGGQHGRTYYLHMFRFTNHKTGIKKWLVCEYATPLRCLHDMAHEFPFIGFQKEQMYEQAERFVFKTRDILKRDTVKNWKGDVSSLVDLVYFDDEKENLLDAIERTLDAGKYKSVPKSDSILKPH